ncbi:MAG: hypothetical protein IJY79_01465 [Clostridia bacterium]|nr:hypothetical protein [Clostridia bacterium]
MPVGVEKNDGSFSFGVMVLSLSTSVPVVLSELSVSAFDEAASLEVFSFDVTSLEVSSSFKLGFIFYI